MRSPWDLGAHRSVGAQVERKGADIAKGRDEEERWDFPGVRKTFSSHFPITIRSAQLKQIQNETKQITEVTDKPVNWIVYVKEIVLHLRTRPHPHPSTRRKGKSLYLFSSGFSATLPILHLLHHFDSTFSSESK